MACENEGVRKRFTRNSRFQRFLPKGKRERRRVEFLGGAAVGAFGVLIVCVFALSGLQQLLLRSPNVAAVVSAILVDLANGDRAASSLGTLTVNPVLVAAAQAKANDMAEKGYFAHISPDGVDPWHWFKEAGYAFTYAGENLAVDFSDSGDVNSAWMNSPTHRENLLNPKYTEIGIATAQGMYQGHLTTFVVQEFGTPAAGKAPVATTQQVPENPAEIATAQPDTGVVLGEQSPAAPIPAKKKSSKPAPVATASAPQLNAVATTDPALAAALASDAASNKPFWAAFVGFPKDTMRYAYFIIGLLVLLALAVDTGLEFRRHHRKRAFHAGILLITMGLLFFAADYFFFADPVLAARDTQAASVSIAL